MNVVWHYDKTVYFADLALDFGGLDDLHYRLGHRGLLQQDRTPFSPI
jgi:hypothetical protein